MSERGVIRDELTGLANEWYFRLIFEFAFSLGDREVPMTLVFFEVDGLDAFEETRGADDRARAVKEFGAIFARVTRQTDVAARVGPERFACLLMVCNLQGAFLFADRIRVAAEGISKETGLTLSAGLVTYDRDVESDQVMIDSGVKALLAAKASGGDTIKLAKDFEEAGLVWETPIDAEIDA